MKIEIGKSSISTAYRIKQKLERYEREVISLGIKSDLELYWVIQGIYASRIFGLCFYRNNPTWDIIKKFKNQNK